MRHLLLYLSVLSPVLAADTIIAPNPFELVWLAALYVGLPIAALAIAFALRRKPFWCAVWIISLLAFCAHRFLEANPATSSKRADVTFVVQDASGRSIGGVQVAITQYAEGRVPKDFVLTSSEDGRVTVVTTSDRKIHGTFRDPKFRYVAFRLDRAYKPTFTEGQFFYDWQVLAKNEQAYRSNTAGIESRFPRDSPLSIPIVLPSREVEDSAIESRMRALLPPPYSFPSQRERPNKAPEPTPGTVTPRAIDPKSK